MDSDQKRFEMSGNNQGTDTALNDDQKQESSTEPGKISLLIFEAK